MKISKKRLIVVGLLAMLVALVLLVGCAPRERDPNATVPPTPGTTESGAAAPVGAWSPQTDCAPCHADEIATLTDPKTNAGNHEANGSGVKCATCHSDADDLGAVHEAASGPSTVKRLKKTTVDEATCTASACHGDAAARVAATAFLKNLTDANGLTVNPHDFPAIDDHKSITCISCHGAHKVIDAKATCLSCHHEGIFECHTCHE